MLVSMPCSVGYGSLLIWLIVMLHLRAYVDIMFMHCNLHHVILSRLSIFAFKFVGVLGTGVPRLACLRPTAWLCERARTAHLRQQALKTLARGQASRGGRHKTSLGASSPGWLARGGEIKARQTSRGPRDVSHDDQDQAGARRAPARTVSLFPLWC